MRHALAGLALITLAACARGEPGPALPVSADPVLAGGVYSSGGGLIVALDLRAVAGRLAVCGVWARGRQSVLTKHSNEGVLATGSVFLGGERVLQGLGFLPEVALAESYAGAPGRCVLTSRAWTPALAGLPVRVRLPTQIVVNDSDGALPFDGGGGGIVVRFRQVPVGPGGV